MKPHHPYCDEEIETKIKLYTCPDCKRGKLTTKETYPFNAGVIYYCDSCKAIFYKVWLSKKDFIMIKL